jgi:SNF2 family DNA or RNA helicase
VKYAPHPYQQTAFDFISKNRSGLLVLDLGLGKTVVTASVVQDQLELGLTKKVLFVAPKRVAQHTLTREFKKWDHLTFSHSLIMGTPKQRIEALKHGDVHIINYDLFVWLIKHWGHDWPYDLVIFDEISKMKSPSSKRFRAFRQIRKHITNVIGLTGTPASQGLQDIWSQVWTVDMGERLGATYSRFLDTYFIKNQWNHAIEPHDWAEQQIHDRIKDIAISMAAEDYLEMPDRLDVLDWVDLPMDAMAQYAALERDMYLELQQGDIAAVNAAVLTNKTLQFVSGAMYHEDGSWEAVHDEKLDALDDIIEAADGPILVAYNFKSDLARLREHFPQARTIEDDKTIDEWNQGEIPILLAHPASAGHGLNLQEGGHRIVWFSLTWSLELYQQFNGRLHRQGQTKPVTVHHIVARNTVDAVVLNALRNKRRVQDALLDAISNPTSQSQGAPHGQESKIPPYQPTGRHHPPEDHPYV